MRCMHDQKILPDVCFFWRNLFGLELVLQKEITRPEKQFWKFIIVM